MIFLYTTICPLANPGPVLPNLPTITLTAYVSIFILGGMRDTMEQQTHFFHALSNDIRLRIVLLLASEPQLSVCQLVRILGLPQPKVSRHLAVLREAGVVAVDRKAQWICYRLGETMQPWQRKVVEATRESLENSRQYIADQRMLAEIRERARMANHPCAPVDQETEEAA